MKCKFDKSLDNLLGVNTWTYQGNPPTTKEEYNSLEFIRLEGTKPTWSSIQTEMDTITIPVLADLKASAKAKLIAGEPLTEEEADTIVL
jgi:hypothetical protein